MDKDTKSLLGSVATVVVMAVIWDALSLRAKGIVLALMGFVGTGLTLAVLLVEVFHFNINSPFLKCYFLTMLYSGMLFSHYESSLPDNLPDTKEVRIEKATFTLGKSAIALFYTFTILVIFTVIIAAINHW